MYGRPGFDSVRHFILVSAGVNLLTRLANLPTSGRQDNQQMKNFSRINIVMYVKVGSYINKKVKIKNLNAKMRKFAKYKNFVFANIYHSAFDSH
jgi:FtsZ-interacting cell division protein ZipA